MRVVQDGVEAMVLPDCAKCEATGLHPHDFNVCPIRDHYGLDDEDICDPDCPYYTEDWDTEHAEEP